jgi:MFS transporter, PHS family, inorganic phosphate transporter
MLQYRLYGGKPLPAGPQGFIKAAANVGSVIGQFGFGLHYVSHHIRCKHS